MISLFFIQTSDSDSGVKELTIGVTKYSVGEFVYVEPRYVNPTKTATQHQQQNTLLKFY